MNHLGPKVIRMCLPMLLLAMSVISAAAFAVTAPPPRTTDRHDPFGSLDRVTPAPGGVLVEGWAIDEDWDTFIVVRIYIDGIFASEFLADEDRPDLYDHYPQDGTRHGFRDQVPATPGSHTVCAYGLNTGEGQNSLLGCRNITLGGPSPFGSLDALDPTPTGIQASGWAIDPETGNAIDVHLYVDGSIVLPLTAANHRPDVGSSFPGYGPDHGFYTAIDLPRGPHRACAYGINTGAGQNRLLGCRQIDSLGYDPFGSFELARSGFPNFSNSILVDGWVIDPDTTGQVQVHYYINGVAQPADVAEFSRQDVGSAFPGYGGYHGFSAVLGPPQAGRNQVCAYGINQYGGKNTLIGCKIVDVPVNPIGSLDTADPLWESCLEITGWTLDPDTAQSISAHYYVNGVWAGSGAADISREDVFSVYWTYGANHGFAARLSVPQCGTYTVCAYGINSGPGGNSLVGCKTVYRPPCGDAPPPPYMPPPCDSISGQPD